MDWPDSIQLRFKGTKVSADWKDFEKRAPGYLLTQDYPEKYFPAFSHLRTQKPLQLYLVLPDRQPSCRQDLASPTRCWFCRHAEFKSCEVTVVSPQTSKGPRSRVIGHRV